MKTLPLMAAALFLALTGAVHAQDYIVLDRTADDYDRAVIEPDGSSRVYDAISRETLVPVDVLQAQRERTRLGYGGLLIGNSLAAESGRSFDEIAALKANGRGWGEIAHQYGVQLGPIVSRVHRADGVFRGNGNSRRDEMKAEKFVNGHDARDGKLDGTGKGARHSRGHANHQRKGKGENRGDGHGKGKGHGGGHGH